MSEILRVAVFTELPFCLDYLPNHQSAALGVRVRVPLKSSSCVGLVVGKVQHSEVSADKLKPIIRVIDQEAIVSDSLLSLLQWVAAYYHYPLGGVLKAALPRLVRRARALPPSSVEVWQAAAAAEEISTLPKQAYKQRALLEWLLRLGSADKTLFDIEFKNWRLPLQHLERKGLVERRQITMDKLKVQLPAAPHLQLNAAQQRVVAAVAAEYGRFCCTLLEGVTGSGKTEVYLALCERLLKAGKQVLVLVPEIALTIQTVARFRARFGQGVQVFHSRLSEHERLCTWAFVADGSASIVIGTRSAAFLAFRDLALIIIDEEHDSSYKQVELLRYHARDTLVKRAQLEGLPIVLGSATPALETLHNAAVGRYRHQRLRQRAGSAQMPRFRTINTRGRTLEGGLSRPLLSLIAARISKREQVLLFINRRGYAPLMMCDHCGETLTCEQCDAYWVYHKHIARLCCHHCGAESAPPRECPACGGDTLQTVGVGTQQIEEKLRQLFPAARVLRIDTDALRHKGALAERLEQIHAGQVDIIVGTQILTKGHHLPAITLTCVVDVDQGLFSPDFRSTERLAQLITQVGGRAGRGDVAGDVVLQTHHPHHPLLHTLLQKGYAALAAELLRSRQQLGFPPYSHFTVLRVAARRANLSIQFLNQVERLAKPLVAGKRIRVYPPIPAAMEKKAGYHRATMLFGAPQAMVLNRYIAALRERMKSLPKQRALRWHFDVDPLAID